MVFKNKKALIEALGLERGMSVLDVGFIGHGLTENSKDWVHRLLQETGATVYGLDLEFDTTLFPEPLYKQASAENFQFDTKFDVIFASDLIEHLSNPGLFLECCKKNLKPGGRLVLTTGNTFCLFNMAEKLTKYEPTTNKDHTCYFNTRTLSVCPRTS